MQHFPSEEVHLPCLLSWKGSFLSLAAGAALLLGFVKAKSAVPLSNIAAIYCHTLPTWVTCQNVFWQPPTSNPKMFMEKSVDLLPVNERVNPNDLY